MTQIWSVPRDWTNGETPDVDMMNTHIRDQFIHIKDPPYAASAAPANIAFSNTTWTGVSSALTLNLITYGGRIEVGLAGAVAAGGGDACFDAAIDGLRIGPSASGLIKRGDTGNAFFNAMSAGVPSGAHVVSLWARLNAGGGLVMSGTLFWAMEYP